MIRSFRPAILVLLGALVPLAGSAAESSGGTPGATPPGPERPPSTTQSVPAQPYDKGTTSSPGSATTTDGSPGLGGTAPPGASPRDAAPADQLLPPLFKELDTDKDGQVTRDEAKRSADATARFGEIDSNRDGRLSPAEWKAAEDRKMGR